MLIQTTLDITEFSVCQWPLCRPADPTRLIIYNITPESLVYPRISVADFIEILWTSYNDKMAKLTEHRISYLSFQEPL